MKEEKEEKVIKKKKPHIVLRIINVIFWIICFVIVCACIIDYFNAKNEEEPQFCIEKQTIDYDDGKVYVCKGIGYKVYHYDRETRKGYTFEPFWY